jgi:hypothetical protein
MVKKSDYLSEAEIDEGFRVFIEEYEKLGKVDHMETDENGFIIRPAKYTDGEWEGFCTA